MANRNLENDIDLRGSEVINVSDLTNASISGDTVISSGDLWINTSNNSYWIWAETEPFKDCWPNWNEFERMCEEYPALRRSLEQMKLLYDMSKADWEGKKK